MRYVVLAQTSLEGCRIGDNSVRFRRKDLYLNNFHVQLEFIVSAVGCYGHEVFLLD